jgi:ABC-type sugar transport system ATPase subunit
MAAIAMKNIVKCYGKAKEEAAVKDVSLAIDEGEFVVLLGPSGCGKTTILRMLAGLEDITDGELWFDDRLMNHEPPDARSVGMVFQNYALYPHMTVYENLAFGLKARGVPKVEVKQRVHDMVALLGIQAAVDHKPKELSGGQRQRVALGRALVRDPVVFLMDEPLSNLDANLREQMRLELARIHSHVRVTTVYVTHDQNEALTLADRVVVMEGGRIRQVGTPSEIYESPADTFVAGFVGSPGMNLWTLRWEDDGEGISLDGAVRLPRSFRPALEEIGATVTVGIRPEHLGMSLVKADVKVICRAEFFENLGSHTQLHAHLVASGTDSSVDGLLQPDSEQSQLPYPSSHSRDSRRLVARLNTAASADPGEEMVLTAPAGAVNLFDPVTGIRMGEQIREYTDASRRYLPA